jgi:hypothetical protein
VYDRDDQARVAIITGAGAPLRRTGSRSALPTMLPACRRAPAIAWGDSLMVRTNLEADDRRINGYAMAGGRPSRRYAIYALLPRRYDGYY